MKKLEEIYLPIKGELERFDEALSRELASSNGFIGSMLRHILKGRGKRVRPALVFLSSNGHAQKSPLRGRSAALRRDTISLAIAIELVHIASLVHDDVIDEAPKRRKAQSLNYKWGNTTSVLLGDFLYAKAFKNVAALRSSRIEPILSDVAMGMCEGELMQIEKKGGLSITEADYLDIIKQKTALLIAASCECGAILNGSSDKEIAALKSYGFNIGMAFQIIDDYLDIKGNGALLGKLTGSDIGKGKLTLPFIYALGSKDKKLRQELVDMISSNGHKRPLELNRIANLLDDLGALDRTSQKAFKYVEAAKGSLDSIGEFNHKDSLLDLADYIAGRDK